MHPLEKLSRRDFIGLCIAIPSLNTSFKAIEPIERQDRETVAASFTFSGINFDFKGWDLYLNRFEVKKLRNSLKGNKLIITDESEDTSEMINMPPKQKTILCRSNIPLSYQAYNGDLVMKMLPHPNNKEFKFNLSVEDRSGKKLIEKKMLYIPRIFSYNNDSILSEREVPSELIKTLTNVKARWDSIAPTPPIRLISWAPNVATDEVGLYHEQTISRSAKNIKDSISIVTSNLTTKSYDLAEIASTQYHEYGHWLYASVFTKETRLAIDNIYNKIGTKHQKKNFETFSESYYWGGGGHPHDEPTELCASMCSILAFAPDYDKRVSRLKPPLRRLHQDLSFAILMGILQVSGSEAYNKLFPRRYVFVN